MMSVSTYRVLLIEERRVHGRRFDPARLHSGQESVVCQRASALTLWGRNGFDMAMAADGGARNNRRHACYPPVCSGPAGRSVTRPPGCDIPGNLANPGLKATTR